MKPLKKLAISTLKLFVCIAGALFIGALAHEATHVLQLNASNVAQPTALVINLTPSASNLSFAQVEWGWREGVTQQQALAFSASLWQLEAVAYAVFSIVFVLIMFALRNEWLTTDRGDFGGQ